MKDFKETLDELAALKPNWNSYGSPPPTPEAIATARVMLDGLHVSPVDGGGVQIDMGPDFEIYIGRDGKVDAT